MENYRIGLGDPETSTSNTAESSLLPESSSTSNTAEGLSELPGINKLGRLAEARHLADFDRVLDQMEANAFEPEAKIDLYDSYSAMWDEIVDAECVIAKEDNAVVGRKRIELGMNKARVLYLSRFDNEALIELDYALNMANQDGRNSDLAEEIRKKIAKIQAECAAESQSQP